LGQMGMRRLWRISQKIRTSIFEEIPAVFTIWSMVLLSKLLELRSAKKRTPTDKVAWTAVGAKDVRMSE